MGLLKRERLDGSLDPDCLAQQCWDMAEHQKAGTSKKALAAAAQLRTLVAERHADAEQRKKLTDKIKAFTQAVEVSRPCPTSFAGGKLPCATFTMSVACICHSMLLPNKMADEALAGVNSNSNLIRKSLTVLPICATTACNKVQVIVHCVGPYLSYTERGECARNDYRWLPFCSVLLTM